MRSHRSRHATATADTTPLRGVKGGDGGESFPEPPAYQPPPPASPPPAREPRRRSGGATAGIILIVVGAIFLAGQVIPGFRWWSLWPLIIVLAGLAQSFTPGREGWSVNRLFDGFVTVAFGLVVLAVTTGLVGFGVVWEVIRLWPALLIAIGLDLLGKGLHTSWVRVLGSVVVIAALAYAVAVSANQVEGFSLSASAGQQAEIREPVGQVTDATLTLDAGVADVDIESGTDLVHAVGESPWGEPDFSVERSGDSANVDLKLGEGAAVWPGGADATLDVQVARDVVWDMRLSTGVSSLDADLSDVSVRVIELRPGVADTAVRLGGVPEGIDEARVLVKAGISTVAIEVPAEVEARIESDSGLTGHSIGEDFESQGSGVWETPGFDSAAAADEGVWIITIDSGIGSIDVDTY